MKQFLTVLIAIAIACPCDAGTISRGSIQHKMTNKETCASGACDTALKFSFKTSIQGTLSPAELSEFSPNTRIQGNFPIGPSITFRLSEDPGYVNGDTSIKIIKTTIFNNVTWKHSISMRWDKGILNLQAKISTSQKVSNFYPMVWEGLPKSKTNFESAGIGLLSLSADNFGVPFLALSANLASTVATKSSAQSKSNGQTRITTSQKIRGLT